MGCRRMLGVEDHAAIMAGVNVGLSKTRIAHLIGRSPSVVCREIARHTGPDGQYRAEEADKAARDGGGYEFTGVYRVIYRGLLLRHDGGVSAPDGLGECAVTRR